MTTDCRILLGRVETGDVKLRSRKKFSTFVGIVLVFLGSFVICAPMVPNVKIASTWASSALGHSYVQLRNSYLNASQQRLLDCGAVFQIDSAVMKGYATSRIDADQLSDVDMDCSALSARVMGNASYEALDRPVAVLRNVYNNYKLQELLLSMAYHPDNWYCFAMDNKSSDRFHFEMRKAASCLNNVVVLNQTFDFDSAGHRQDEAHFACLELLRPHFWYHALLLQVHFPQCWFQSALDWTPRGLKLFKNESAVGEEYLSKLLLVRKDLNQAILSKTFVESIFDHLYVERLIEAFDDPRFFGVDEMLKQTLFSNYLGLAGQMESACFNETRDVVRFTIWNWSGDEKSCQSRRLRHGVCIIGLEDLPFLESSDYIIGNKVLAEFDLGVVFCAAEMLHNRSAHQRPSKFSREAYSSLPQVREVRAKLSGVYEKSTFSCDGDD